MSKIIKKFDQYIKENTSTDADDDMEMDGPIEGSDLDAIEELEALEEEEEDIDTEDDDLIDDDDDDDDTEDREYEEEEVQEEEEEEYYQYMGNKLLKELADKLGESVIDNEIIYKGKKINYFSETECFHIDNEKFETVDQAFQYLVGGSNVQDEEE